MKPFFLFLLLILSGIFFSALTRPVKLLTEATQNLAHLPERLKAKLQRTSVDRPADRGQPASAGDNWQAAAQF